MKVCPICKIPKPLNEFGKRGTLRPNEPFGYCKICASKRRKREWLALKLEMFEAYGGLKCRCCGLVGHHSFFALDHINNDGAAERRELGRHGSGIMFYARLKKLGWPKGYQILCHTCNVAKSIMGGTCPHSSLFGDSVIGNIPGSEPGDSRSES